MQRRPGPAGGPEAALRGRLALVTGANSGLGLATAAGLAARGAEVILACRHPERAAKALDQVQEAATGTAPSTVALDLADLTSISACARELTHRYPSVDVVVANAGVMATPPMLTFDGFELQLGTNHLGHFALIGQLWPVLGPGARVVTVSSVAAGSGAIHFDDLQSERGYDPWAAYSQSKLANLLFARELDRRAAGAVTSVAVHPGYSRTRLWANCPGPYAGRRKRLTWHLGGLLLAQSAAAGARPAIQAAGGWAGGGADGGAVYLAPRGPFHLWGAPTVIRWPRAARDDDAARRLWDVSEDLTGVRYPFGGGAGRS